MGTTISWSSCSKHWHFHRNLPFPVPERSFDGLRVFFNLLHVFWYHGHWPCVSWSFGRWGDPPTVRRIIKDTHNSDNILLRFREAHKAKYSRSTWTIMNASDTQQQNYGWKLVAQRWINVNCRQYRRRPALPLHCSRFRGSLTHRKWRYRIRVKQNIL